jgi:hypothetical protein
LGDSTYVIVAHNIGISSIMIVIGLYSYLIYRGVSVRGVSMFLPVIALALTGLALPTLFNIKGVIVVGYVLSKIK